MIRGNHYWSYGHGKGQKEGTLTDIDGNFSVKGKVGNTLSISYVGFSPLEVKVTKL